MTLSAPMRCSALAEELGEPMIGSIEQRVRWLLVEDRSPWGEKAVRDELGPGIESAAKARAVRLLLIRRREGDPAADDATRRVFLVDTAEAAAATREVSDVAELPELMDATLSDFGVPFTDSIFLVCTNGKRDACCALRGRPLVAALLEAQPEAVWECSHIGGHRFAGNLVCLPHGLVYGRVGAGDGPRLADAYRSGRLDVDHLRGRSAWPVPAQVAELRLRRELGLAGVDDVRLLSTDGDDRVATVALLAGGAEHRFELRAEPMAPPRHISCRADELESPVHWVVR